MKSLFRRWLKSGRSRARSIPKRELSLERLDERLVPTAGISARGGQIVIEGTEAADTVEIRVLPGEQANTQFLIVDLENRDGLSESRSFKVGAAAYAIRFDGLGGNDHFVNKTIGRAHV